MENNNQEEQLNINLTKQSNENVTGENLTEAKWVEEFKTDNDKLMPDTSDIPTNDSQELELETIKDAEKQVKEQQSKKGKWLTISFFIINIFVFAGILVYQYNTFGVKKLESFFVEDKNFKYIIFAGVTFVAIMLLESLRNYVLILKSTKMHRPFLAYKVTALRKYYNGVTPASTGGKPFEMLYLRSRGIRAGVATSITFAKFIFNLIAFISLGVILLAISGWKVAEGAVFATVLAIISLIVIGIILLFILFLSLSKVWAPKLILSVLKFLQKFKIIKDYHSTFKKIMRFGLEYQRSIKYFASNFTTLLISFITAYGVFICKALIAFFIYCAFNGLDTSMFITIFTKIILCELVVKLIPLPGGTVVSEFTFTTMFISLFNNGSIFWALLIWRMLDYFIYLLQGIIVVFYDFIIGNKINKKMLEKYKMENINEVDITEYEKYLS